MSQRQIIILFDGGCVLCSGFARFLIARDRRAAFRLLPLQSADAARECARIGLRVNAPSPPDSIIVLDGDRALERSDAILAIAAAMPPPWSLLRALRVIPRRLRDALYRFIARRRDRVFGRRSECDGPCS